jgi:serine/threonine protein kinase
LNSATEVPVSVDASDARLGQLLFDRYQVRRVVADGGMGRVYEALDKQEKRHVALKILHAELAKDQIAVERFKREFEVSSQLSNVHIVEVLDFTATADGSHALVMEFLQGEELRATLKRERRLPRARVVRLVSQVALGLDDAHAKSLVHRDLKPDNLFLCQTAAGDMVKVLDFGSVRDNAANAKKLTVVGTTIGSPFYMSPEQAQGLDGLDRRADVWSLAAIAYECLTGEVPFMGNNGPSILLEILTKEPRLPSSVAGGIPRGVERALLHALKKPVGLRTSSVGQFADELGAGFGLAADHERWARTPEHELEQQMAEAQAARLNAPASEPVPASASDEFFGELGGLGWSERSPAIAEQPRAPASEAARKLPTLPPTSGATSNGGHRNSAPANASRSSGAPPSGDVPSSLSLSPVLHDRSRWLAVAGVAVVALLVGIALVLLLN